MASVTDGAIAYPETETPPERSLFGHPIGLAFLAAVEGLIYFAYTGTQALIMLYMTQRLFTPGHVESVIGFTGYRALLETLFGPTSLLGLASQTFGLFTGLMYALPLVGALIGDRWLGQRRTAIIGLVVLACGYALVIGERTYLLGLGLAILGNGLVKTNLMGQIGRLYAPDDQRSARGFGVYLIAINIGSFASPLVCGGLAQWLGWHWGFVPLGLANILAIVIYGLGRAHVPQDTVRVRRDGTTAPAKLQPGDGRILAMLLLLIALDLVYVGTYNQSFDILPVWADSHVDRTIGGLTMPAAWFSSVDGVFTILGTTLTMRLWAWQAKRGREPGDVTKFAIGIVLAVLAFAVLALGSARTGLTPLAYPLVYFALIDTAITWADLLVLSMVSRLAPRGIASTMLGVYLLSTMVSNFQVGWLGTFYERMSPAAFWAMHAGIVACVLPVLFLASGWIRRTLALAHALPPEPARA